MSGCGCSRKRCRIGPDDPRHGTHNGYGNYGCGCESCRAANARYCYEAKRRRVARGIPDHVHGTVNGYGGWACRCDPCTAAWARNANDRYHRRRAGVTDVAKGLCSPPHR